MTPTPLTRPYSISVERRIWWALKTISRGLIGDGQNRAELTPDGIAATLLGEAIESRWPGLLDGYKRREALDAEYVKKVAEAVRVNKV